MSRTKKWSVRLNLQRLLMVVLLVLFGFLMMDLNTRLQELSRVSAQRDLVKTQVAAQVATQQYLNTRIAYVGSDEYVEEWARQEAHMAKPGDHVIVPLPPENAQSTPTPLILPTVEPAKPWEVWWALFFGE
ncbi:MAG: septum formation initiator family protein [Anaerolineales bacterium]